MRSGSVATVAQENRSHPAGLSSSAIVPSFRSVADRGWSERGTGNGPSVFGAVDVPKSVEVCEGDSEALVVDAKELSKCGASHRARILREDLEDSLCQRYVHGLRLRSELGVTLDFKVGCFVVIVDDQLERDRVGRGSGAMLGVEVESASGPAKIEGAVGPRMEIPRATQRLAVGEASVLSHVMDDGDGDPEGPLELTEEGEEL